MKQLKIIKGKQKEEDTESDSTESGNEKTRELWTNEIEFFLSLLGYVVGLGNIIRFPYLVMHNGGGSFLIPYFFYLFVCGIPLYFLEITFGQRARKSSIGCWDNFVPALKGVGYTMVVMCFICTFYYQVYISWILYYMSASLVSIVKWDLPWKTCNASWNTENCVTTVGGPNATIFVNYKNAMDNVTDVSWDDNVTMFGDENVTSKRWMTAAEEYWQYNVLRLSDDITDLGYPSWELSVAHIVGWFIMYMCLRQGVRSVGKVVWVTATAPYLLITIFLVRAALLPGSMDGIRFYLTPDFDKLKDTEVWVTAFLQIFYSLGPGWGGIITMASYNDFHHNYKREAILIPITTCLTSFFNGFVVFSCAGFLANISGVPVGDAMASGHGLAFITYPEVTSHLPGGPIWAFLFFLMMFMVGLDSTFVMIETCASPVRDQLKDKYKKYPLIVIALFMIPTGLLMVTRAGIYICTLVDWYFSGLGLFSAAAAECIGLIWIYGYRRLSQDMETMIGSKLPNWLIVPIAGVVVPIIIVFGMVWCVANLSKPSYGSYQFPEWCVGIGWALAVLAVLPIPIVMVIRYLMADGDNWREKVKSIFRPLPRSPEEERMKMENIQVV